VSRSGRGSEARTSGQQGDTAGWSVEIGGHARFREVPAGSCVHEAGPVQVLIGPQETFVTVVQRVVIGPGKEVEPRPLQLLHHKRLRDAIRASGLSGRVSPIIMKRHLQVGEPDIGLADDPEQLEVLRLGVGGHTTCDQKVPCSGECHVSGFFVVDHGQDLQFVIWAERTLSWSGPVALRR